MQVNGHLPGSADYSYWETTVGNGSQAYANIRPNRAYTQDAANAIAGVYQDTVAQAVWPSAVAAWEANFAAGGSIAAMRQAMATAWSGPVVTAAWQAILNHPPGANDVSWWVGQIAAGNQTIATLRTALTQSTELVGDLTSIYPAILGRQPSSAEIAFWQNWVANGQSLNAFWTTVAYSPEAQGDITAIIGQVLNRGTNATEIGNWEAYFAGGGTQAGMKNALATSTEAQNDINGIYLAVYGRTTQPADMSWAEKGSKRRPR